MPRPKAILFDLDATLISSSGERQEVWAEAFAPHLHRFAERTEAELTREIEAELRWFWSEPVRHPVLPPPPTVRPDLTQDEFFISISIG